METDGKLFMSLVIDAVAVAPIMGELTFKVLFHGCCQRPETDRVKLRSRPVLVW